MLQALRFFPQSIVQSKRVTRHSIQRNIRRTTLTEAAVSSMFFPLRKNSAPKTNLRFKFPFTSSNLADIASFWPLPEYRNDLDHHFSVRDLMPLLGFLGSGQQAISLLIKRKKKIATTSK
jgi:hypothetical protein